MFSFFAYNKYKLWEKKIEEMRDMDNSQNPMNVNNSHIHALLQNNQVNALLKNNFVKVTFKKLKTAPVLEGRKPRSLSQEEKEFLYYYISWLLLIDNIKIKIRQSIQRNGFILDNFLLLFYVTGFVTNIIQDQMYFDFETIRENDRMFVSIIGKPTTKIQIIRFITTITTCIIMLLLPFHYKIARFLLILKGEYDPRKRYWTSPQILSQIIITYIITIFHVPPYLDEVYVTIPTTDEESISVKVNLILIFNVLITLRCFLFFIYFAKYSRFSNDRADKICEESNVKNNIFFILKSQLKDSPVISIIFLFLLSIFIFGYMLRNTELAFMVNVTSSKFQNWTNLWNGFWCITMSFFTVGYGDFYPQTILGRIVLFFSLIWGMFLVGLLVLHFSSWFVLSQKEKKVYNETIEEFELAKKKKQALKVIYAYFKAEVFYEMNEDNKDKKYLNKLMEEVIAFKNLRKYNEIDSDKMQIEALLEKMNTLNDKDADDLLIRMQTEVEDTNKKIKKAKINQFKIKRYLNTIHKLTKNLHDCIKDEK